MMAWYARGCVPDRWNADASFEQYIAQCIQRVLNISRAGLVRTDVQDESSQVILQLMVACFAHHPSCGASLKRAAVSFMDIT